MEPVHISPFSAAQTAAHPAWGLTAPTEQQRSEMLGCGVASKYGDGAHRKVGGGQQFRGTIDSTFL